MTVLDELPFVNSFFTFDLRTGSLIIAAIGLVHPLAYGFSLFLPTTFLVITAWILVVLYFVANVVLIFGLIQNDVLLCIIWTWYTLFFVMVMTIVMISIGILYTSRKHRKRILVVILGILWYILTVYFIIVVNSYRMKIK